MCEQVLMVFLELVQRMNLIGVAEGNFDILSPAGSPNICRSKKLRLTALLF